MGVSQPSLSLQGRKFIGDLQPDGRILWQETGQVFNSPSAWATHCKKLVNPAKKSGCGWASVKYKGQKLDKYKAAWLRRHQLHMPVAAADEVTTRGALLEEVCKGSGVGHGLACCRNKSQGRREAGKDRQGQQGLLGWRKDFSFDPKRGGNHEMLWAEGAAPWAHLLTIIPWWSLKAMTSRAQTWTPESTWGCE